MAGGNYYVPLINLDNNFIHFTGEGSIHIDQWIEYFELNFFQDAKQEIQSYYIACQLLKGAAKKYLRTQRHINTWSALKLSLSNEFAKCLELEEKYKLLKQHKKSKHETNLEYLYSFIEMGQDLQMSEQCIIQYFVAGIKVSGEFENMLKQCTSYDELKLKLKMKFSENITTNGATPAENYNVQTPENIRFILVVYIGQDLVFTPFYLDCNYCVINELYLCKLNRFNELDYSSNGTIVVNSTPVDSIGLFTSVIEVDNIPVTITFFVVQCEYMSEDLILGRNLLEKLDIIIDVNGLSFKKK